VHAARIWQTPWLRSSSTTCRGRSCAASATSRFLTLCLPLYPCCALGDGLILPFAVSFDMSLIVSLMVIGGGSPAVSMDTRREPPGRAIPGRWQALIFEAAAGGVNGVVLLLAANPSRSRAQEGQGRAGRDGRTGRRRDSSVSPGAMLDRRSTTQGLLRLQTGQRLCTCACACMCVASVWKCGAGLCLSSKASQQSHC
jgi:hypothetical protein